jgi:hypothetical protein
MSDNGSYLEHAALITTFRHSRESGNPASCDFHFTARAALQFDTGDDCTIKKAGFPLTRE